MMADEQVSVEVPPVPEQPLDHDKKRKLGDFEVDAPDTVDAEPKSDEDNEDGIEKEENDEKAGESELKRPRLGASENGTENGHQDKGDKLGELEEKADQQPKSRDDIVTGEGDSQEQAQEVSASGDTEKAVDADGQAQGAAEKEQSSDPNVEQNIGNESEDAKQEGLQPSSAGNQDVDDSAAEQKEGSGDQVRKIDVSNSKVGVLIGKGGDTIRYLQYNSGAKIQIMRDAEADPRATTRPVELIGTLESIEKAEKLINDVIAEADAGGSPSLVARGFSTVQSVVGDQVEIQVPNEKVGLIIGKGGDTIKNLQTRSGARIQLVPQHLPSGDQSKERTVRITGDKKQIEVAREMIKEVMNQLNVRPSPLSGGHGQQAFRPRGPVAPHWGQRNPHPSQLMGYDYPQRGPYQSQSQQYPPPYGNYPPQQTTRAGYGPGWEQRPPSAMQGPPQNYNYGQPQGPDYGHPGPYSQTPAQSYGQGGYNEMRYDNTAPAQHPYGGPGVSQQAGYHHGGGPPPTGYGPQDHYGRAAPYGMQPQQPQGQTYGQPRPSQPGENPYQAPVSSTQPYSSNVPPQQSYPYATSGAMQQSYPMYGSGPTPDGYAQPAPAATGGPVYPQQGGQPVSGYGQPGAQQASGFTAGGPTAGYGSYPSQPGYAEQPAVNNAAYGYQAADAAAYASSAQGSTAYAAPTAGQTGYAQPAPAQPGYDQSVAQSGGYGTAAAPAGYGKSVSPQPGYAQYDSSQMYGAPR